MAYSAQDILDFLLANDNRGNTLSTAQVAQLESDFRVRLAQVSVSVPGQAPDAITLLYNGDLSGDIKSYQLAEAIGRDSGGKVITLGQTESGKLLIDNAGTFRDHLINYLGGDTPEAGIAFDNLIKGTDASGTKVPGGSVFDVASAHMVEQAPGEFRAIAPFPREGVYTETEIARYLESSSSAKLEGIDKVVYQTIYDDARIRTGSDAAARFEVAKAASYMAWQNTMELVAAANPDGTLSTGAGGYATKVETGKFFVENPALAQSLPEGATRLSISDEMGKLMTDPQWSALAEGEATLRNALKSIESARPSLPPASVDIFNSAATKLGLVLGVASILVANHDAKAAEREGNYEKAAAIWRDWGVGMAGGIVVGELFAGAMIAMAGAPVTLGGSALFFVASAAIGVLGGEAALGLMHSASNGPTSGGGGSGGGSGADAAAIPEIVNINAGRDTLVISRGGGGESASLNASQDRPLMMSGTAPDGTKYQVTGNRNAYELELQSATGEYLGGSRTLVREDGARFVQIIGPDGNPTNEYLGYTVKQGDTLSGIASRYGVSLASVVDANSQIANPDLIYPGQTVEVPVPMGEGLPVDNTHLDLQTSFDPFGTPIQGTTGSEADGTDNHVLHDGFVDAYFTGGDLGDPNDNGANTNGQHNIAGGIVTDWWMPAAEQFSPNDFSASIRSLESFFGPTTPVNSYDFELFGSELANLTCFGGDYLAIDPLVLDLNGDGVQLTSYADAPVLFDIDQDVGSKEVTGWVGSEDGIVVMDVNGNGRIDDISETLSEYFNQEVGAGGTVRTQLYANGFAALNSLDSNGDQAFTNADAAWNPLDAALNVDVKKQVRVWIDANHDGLTDSGELHTLDSLGITSISLASTNQSGLVNGGNEILASGTFTQTVIDASTGSARTEVREAQAANFIANPNGHSFIESGNGTLIATQGSGASYVSHSAVGETIDVVTIVTGGVVNATGATGDDTLIGDAQTNWLAGGQGSDSFNAGAGDDVLLIDSQDLQQNIHAGAGFDIVHVVGDGGVTLNLAQAEIETAIGGRGNDILIGGGRSNVFIEGGQGDDILIGGAADDALNGNDGADLIDGGAGDDLIRGHRGQDQLMGGAGNDYLDGGQDNDRLNGGTGNDVLIGGQGDDALEGGDGYDIAELAGSYADYRITQFNDTTWRVVDTKAGRDGADMLTNIEAVSFADIKNSKLDDATPMPVDDIIDVDGAGTAFTRTATARTILKNQILGNDIVQPGDVLHLTAITDVQGGSAIINGNGDVVFTPNASYTGIMSFKYQMADAENNQSGVSTISGQSAPMKGTVSLKTADVPSDPLVTDQWYLSEANILPVWNDYTGKGVSIAQFEPGSPFTDWPQVFDYRHPDLAPNVDPSWLADPDNPVPQSFSNHATMVAGVMVAARNGEGGVGVAYGATLSGVYLPDFGTLLSEVPSRLYQMKDYDVVNGSFDFPAEMRFYNLSGYPDPHEQAAALGRGYLGTVMVYAAGNERAKGGNTNDSNFTKSRWTITVGAINATGDLGSLIADVKPFSNPGASILVSAPGSNIASTSRLIQSDGGSTFGTEYSTAEGTSLATPIVSGIVALMLEANPNLRYRDVQEILAMSAKNVTDSATDWTYNTSTRWNAGGMQVSHDYGFGEVDALAAVRLAESWRPAKDYLNETSVSAQNNSGGSIPDGAGYIERTFTIAAGVTAEHVELSLNLTHDHLGDLVVELYSPTWTKSVLMNRPGKAPGSDASDTGDNLSGLLVTTLSTVHDWGEDSGGTWRVRIYDAAEGNAGSLGDMTLSVYGESASAGDDTYVFTNEYSTLFAGSTRSTLSDSNDGFDTINAAAVTTASTINLASGSTSTIAGKSLVLSGMFESAVGGDGDDSLMGTADFNDLAGGRGNDTLSGGEGFDFLDGGRGHDSLAGGADPDMFVIKADSGSTDTILDFSPTQGLEKILIVGFDNISDFTQLDIVDDGSDTVISLGQGQTVVLKNVTRGQLSEQNFTFITKTAMNAPGIDPLQIYKTLLSQNSISWGDDNPQELQFPSSGPSAANYFAQGGNDQLKHSGANSVLDGGNGDDLIYADYLAPVEGADWVDGGSGSDWLESGGFADFVAGGAGDDVIFGGAGNDYLRGDAGRDAIYGDDGNDELIGGTEADYLEGGAGNDTLLLDGDIGEISTATSGFYGTRVGGAGADVFRVVTGGGGTPGVFLSEGIVAASNLIADFNVGEAGEAIDLSNYTWIRGMPDLSISSQTLGSIQVTTISASNGSDTIYVNLAGVAGELNAGNFKFAAAFGLVLGGAGNDQLPGDAGGNTLDGGAGADAMTGRTGDDTYLVDNAGDTVIELPDGGFDTIKSGVNYTLAANVENLVLTGTATNGTGNDAANRIVGNAANNVLDGKGGVDALLGGAGDDTYVVDSQADAVVEYAGEGRDAVLSSVSYTLGNNIENLTLTGTDSINATGNDLVNTLTGNAGDNILDGAAGVDTMAGGAGDDTYLVDNVGDVVMENVSEGIDTVYSTVNYTLGADVENLVLATGAISGTGNTLDNWLSGNSAANLLTGGAGNDMLDGGVGADTLIGGTGDDTYVVDTAGDVVTELAGEGSDTVVASVSFDLSASPDLESVVLAGTANLNVTGNAADNRLVGNAGVNALSGGAGNDTLDGGAGADALAGGTGDDSYVVDNAGDTVTENAGEGVDTVLSSIGYTLGANLENITLTGGGAINGTGNSLDNTLTGNWNANVLDGEVGNDTLDGGGGADTLIGGAGDDTYKFSVGGGTDTIVDTGGTDQLVFGAGIVASGVTASRTGFQVTLTVSATDSVTFDETIPGQYAVEGIVFAGDTNTVWQASDIRQKVNFAPTGIVGVGGTAIQGQTLTASNTLADADGLGTVSYQWQSSTDGSAWAAIAGATSNTFTLTQAQVGQLVRVNAGYTDGHGTTESIASSPTAVVTGYQAGTANNDSLIGTAYSDTLLGLDGNDTLDGGAGNDTLDGGTGVDTMIGGVGDDRFVVDDSGDVVTENANAGTDTVQSSIAYTLGANVENLTLTGTSDINGTGNSLANSLTGNSGANALSGGIDNDTYVIDNIGDMVIENANAGWDIVKSSITYSLGINVECLMLTGTSAIDGTGNSLANYLAGNSAANTLTGGAGNDQYMDIDGADVVVEKVGEGADWVYSSNSYTLGSNVENLTLTGTAAIDGTGNALNNILIGNGAATRLTGDAGNDTLNGGAGADTMAGGFGDDIYYVDNSGDVVIENLGAGYDRVYSTVSYALIPDVERLDLTGNSAINGTGNASSNWLQGNSQANVLDGGASADLLVGGLGNDTYLFARGYQADRIHDLDKTVGNTDLVSFADGIAADQLWFRHVGNDLEVSIIGTSDKLTIQYWYFNASDYHVEQFKTSTGKLLTDARVENLVQAMAAFSPPAAGQTTLPQSYQDALATTIAANWQ